MATPSSMNYFITGGASGIGRGLTRLLLSRGHRVFLLDSNQAELANTYSLLSTTYPPSEFKCSHTDLSDRSQIVSAVASASIFFNGHIDVLINNAFPTPHTWSNSASMDSPNSQADILAEWDKKVAVGLTAPFVLSRLCIPLLTSPGMEGLSRSTSPRSPGTIIHVSSTRAHQSEQNHEAYSAVKAGLLGLTQSMAVSLGHQHGIRVNCISPGWINVETERSAADLSGRKWEDGLTDGDHEWHPAGRVGKVEDIEKAVRYLVESDFVTGQEVVVDGGVSKKMMYPE